MTDCGSNVFNLPSSVNATLFFSLIQQGNVVAALSLLPPEFLSRFSLNSSGLTPVKKNCTIRGPDADSLFKVDVTLILVYAWILLLTSVIGIIGNSIVITVYSSKPKDLTTYRWLLIHLACCDLCFSVLQIVGAVPSLQSGPWPYGNVGCKVMKSTIQLGAMVAIGTLLIIAMERYLAVLRPFHRSHPSRRVAISLAVVWVVSVSSIVPTAIAYRSSGANGDCDEDWNHSGLKEIYGLVYSYYILIVFFMIPLALIGIAYVRMAKFLWKSGGSAAYLYASSSSVAIEKRRKDDRRRIRTLLVVVVVFSLCVLPRKIFWIIARHVEVEHLPLKSYYALVYSGMLPYPFHVAVNPIIYSLIDARFRQSVKFTFRSLCRHIMFCKPSKRDQAIILEPQKTRKETISSSLPPDSVEKA